MMIDFDKNYMWNLVQLITESGLDQISSSCNGYLTGRYLLHNDLCDVSNDIKHLYNPYILNSLAENCGFKLTSCIQNESNFRLDFMFDRFGKSIEFDNPGKECRVFKKQIPVWVPDDLESLTGIELGSRYSSQKYKSLITADIADAEIIVDETNCSLPITDNLLDIIVCEHTVEHVNNEKVGLLINECYRCLKKGGMLIIECPDTKRIQKALCAGLCDNQLPYDQSLSLFKLSKSAKESKEYKRSFVSGLNEGVFDVYSHLSKVYLGIENPRKFMPHINLQWPEKLMSTAKNNGFYLKKEEHGRNSVIINDREFKLDLRLVFIKL